MSPREEVLLAVPFLPAVIAAAAAAVAVGTPLAVPVACVLLAGTVVLASLSVGPRRAAWGLAALAAAGVAVRGALPALVLAVPLPFVDDVRAALARPITALVPAPESAILLGIVLGERDDIPTAVVRAFAASGTTHLLAISGFNMTLVASVVTLALARRAPVVRALVSILSIALYTVLVGPAPSVLRAALMSAVATCGVIAGRRAATANALCVAVTAMVVADPAAVGDAGLQLSAAATAGLVLWQAPLALRLASLPPFLRDGLATTLAATAPTLPIVAAVFGRASIVSPLANLLAVPLFPALMLAGAATGGAGVASLDAARPVALLAWGTAALLRLVVETAASLPIAAVALPPGWMSGVAMALVEVAVVVVIRRAPHVSLGSLRLLPLRMRGPRVGTHAVLAVVAALVASASAGAVALAVMPTQTRVVALDVGQGDAYLVQAGDALALIDGGPDGARLMEELGATLSPWRRRIDVVALTHAHTDHGAGLVTLLDHYDVGLAIEPDGLNAGPLADLWAAGLERRGIPREAVHAGQRIALGHAAIDVLAPDPDLAVAVPSLVLRVSDGAFHVLFTGDAVDDALRRVLERPEQLRAGVYVPPHHGAETPLARALRDAARPRAALISVGAGNRYGHPTASTLAALAGIPTYRTDQDGTVEIALDGTGLVVRTHANGLPPPRRGSVPYPPSRQ